jgi:hypothetical protein
MFSRRVSLSVAGAISSVLLVSISPLAIAADSASESSSGKIPDLLGPWQNLNRFKLAPVPGAPYQPVGDLTGFHHLDRGVDANGKDFSGNYYVGDYTNPILSAAGSAILKKNAEAAQNEHDPFWPATFCYPFGPTALLQPQPVIFLQQPDKVTIIYERDHQVRNVYLNVPHSQNPKPSWYGESVGRYEGDTLVVDTIGFNGKAYVDRYGTPYSDQLHMTERYKVSPDGKAMQVDVTYEDANMYAHPWNSVIRYRKGNALPTEESCAESAEDPVNGKLNPIPVAAKSDF